MNGRKVVSGQWSVVSGTWALGFGSWVFAKTKDQRPKTAAIHPSSFILHTSPRRGVSLLEVLISIFVLAVGLLGVLAIIPLGQMTIAESVKADRAGACGRAVMRNIKVRRMLDFRNWIWDSNCWGLGYNQTATPDAIPNLASNFINLPEATGSFMIDPLGRSKNLPNILYGKQSTASFLPRRTLNNPGDFYWPDDLALDTPANATERPGINPAVGLADSRSIDYSYLFTVSPSSSERWMSIPKRRFFDVTVVVFFKRNLNLDSSGYPEGEWVADVKDISGMPAGSVSPGGGTITLGLNSSSDYNYFAYKINGNASNGCTNPLNISNSLPAVRDGQWVMLWDKADGRLAWYRVIGVNFPDVPSATDQPTLTLDGPDWIVSQNHTEKLIVIDGAIGAYTSTVELDFDPLWQGMY
jgi:prepilin-type N-terminal cleavage/methylation domain-containing protein